MLLVKKININTTLTQVRAEWIMFSPEKCFFWSGLHLELYFLLLLFF